MEAYGGVRAQIHSLLTSALEGCSGQLHFLTALPAGGH